VRNSKSNLTRRAKKIIRKLRRVYPDARCALRHRNPLQLLVATILSAQCTDKRVNMVTPALFA
jgi:endonuclease-3